MRQQLGGVFFGRNADVGHEGLGFGMARQRHDGRQWNIGQVGIGAKGAAGGVRGDQLPLLSYRFAGDGAYFYRGRETGFLGKLL